MTNLVVLESRKKSSALSNMGPVCKAVPVAEIRLVLAFAGLQPSMQAYNALLEAWALQGNAFETAMLYDDMQQRQIRPDLCTFIALFEVGL